MFRELGQHDARGQGKALQQLQQNGGGFYGDVGPGAPRFFKTAGDHACGRLSPGQVNREIYEAGISKPHWQRWVFGGVLALLTAGTAKSETVNEPRVRMEQFPLVKGGDLVADDSHEDTTGRYVEGYVYDRETKAPLEFCYVRIEGAGLEPARIRMVISGLSCPIVFGKGRLFLAPTMLPIRAAL